MELSSVELEEKFNDWLDDKYGSIKVGWYTYSASLVLYKVDSNAYEQEYYDWLNANGYKEI